MSHLPKCTTEFVVVHIFLSFLLAPKPSNFIRLLEFKLAEVGIPLPHDGVLHVGGVEQVQQELPQLQVSILLVGEETPEIMNIEIRC